MRGIRCTLLLGAALALIPAVSSADDPYAAYRIPAHNWHSWSAGLTSGGDHAIGNTALFGEQQTLGNLNGALSTRFDAGFDSDPSSGAYGLSLAASGQRDHRTDQRADTLNSFDASRHERNASEIVNGFFAFSEYMWDAPVGFSIASDQHLRFDQSWSSNDFASTSSSPFGTFEFRSASNQTSGNYFLRLAADASVSLGRIRDATPVYQVQVLEERLLEQGTIQRALSPAARERLAALYTMEGRLSFAHQRPTKYFWGELERLLREDGVLSEAGLDAYAVQRLLEPLTIAGQTIARPKGFAVGPIVELATQRTHEVEDGSFSSATFQNDSLLASSTFDPPRQETNHRDDQVFSGLFVDYHEPFSMHWQADATSRALVSEGGDDATFLTALRGTWLVTDRWIATTFLSHFASAPGTGWDRKVERWEVGYGASVNYFFEDSWAFVLSAQQQQAHDLGGYRRDESFSLGISYQISGLLNAPGLFEPMRLSSPTR